MWQWFKSHIFKPIANFFKGIYIVFRNLCMGKKLREPQSRIGGELPKKSPPIIPQATKPTPNTSPCAKQAMEEIDFSSYNIGDQRFQTKSFSKMYEMSAKRKWQWLRNLIFLKKYQQQIKNEKADAAIVDQFLKKENLLADTDLSFSCNPLPLLAGDKYVNQVAFEEYLSQLAHYRHYHLFSHVLFHMIKLNSVSTVDLLKNLMHVCDQLVNNHFFDKTFTLLYIKDKSQQWIASLIYRILPKKPSTIVALGSWDNPCYEGGEKNVLICDDICYTGTQVTKILSALAKERSDLAITVIFARMSIYALSVVNEKIKQLKQFNSNLSVNIIVGQLFHTLSAQLDNLPFPPTKNERHIIMQVLESDFSAKYKSGEFRRKPLLTTAWKKPDFMSSYYKFLGFEDKGPDPLCVSSALLPNLPSEPITLFSPKRPAPNVKVSNAFISGPKFPPYKRP